MMRPLRPFALAFFLLTTVSPIWASDIQLVSHSERAVIAWEQATVENDRSSLSADGRFVVFTTDNPTSSQDLNGGDDVILVDRVTGQVTLVSHAADDPERAGDDDSNVPAISADGNWVIFRSRATDLVSGFTNPANRTQLYAWDRSTGLIRLVSHTAASQTTGGNGDARGRVVVSADGAFVVFESRSTDHIVGTDTNGSDDLFRWSRATGDIELVSRSAASPTIAGNGFSGRPSLSADGHRVAFESRASDLVAGGSDVNGAGDVFIWEGSTGTVTLVSESTAGGGATANGDSFDAKISADGTVVVFISVATDLVAATDPVSSADIFRWVASSGTLELVSHVVGDPSTAANGNSFSPVVSADGQTVVFNSRATDLVAASDPANDDDIFRWRAATGTAELLSSPDGGATASLGSCFEARISDDASHVVMECVSSDLVPGTDNNGSGRDVFLWRETDGMVQVVSRLDVDPNSTGSSQSQDGQVSADGSTVLFRSDADDLVATLVDSGAFLFDTATGMVEVASRPNAISTNLFISPGSDVRTPALSGDGRFVAFQSRDPFFIDGVTTDDDQIYLYDRVQGEFALVSRSAADPWVGGSRNSMNPQVSEDGSAVVFVSTAPDLVAGATNVNVDQIYHWDRPSGVVRLVSHVPGNELEGGENRSREPLVSADGRTVFFVSRSDNLTTGGDGNFSDDVFMWDAATGDVRLVSRSAVDATVTADEGSNSVSITPDGRYAVFRSGASDLISGFVSVGFVSNVFLWDRVSGNVELVTASTAGPLQSANGTTFRLQISADGSAVVLDSEATDLLAGYVSSGTRQIFHWHRATGEMRLVSRAAGTTTTAGDALATDPVVSGDGDVVAFASNASDLVAGQVDAAGFNDVFVWIRSTGEMELASRSIAGSTTTADDSSSTPSISTDGTRVLFESDATNLVPGFTSSGEGEVFFYDRSAGTVRLVSRSVDGPNTAPPEYGSGDAVLSADGRWVAFLSNDRAFTQGFDPDDTTDIYLASLVDPANVDLQLTLSTPAVTPLPPSAPFSLEVTVDNLSAPSAAHLYAMLDLPMGVDFLGFSGAGWTCEVYIRTLSCGGGALSGGSSDILTLDLQAPAVAGPFSIGGSTIWPGADPDLSNNITIFDAVVATDDWGDAPDPTYPTLNASNGAHHGLSGLFLGNAFDVDEDGQPVATADGDDMDGSDDDDGVTLPTLFIQGQAETVDVVASGAGLLDAWMDWNADGDWSDPGEQIADDLALVAGSNALPLAVPIDAVLGETFARFRLSSTGVAGPTGAAADGEVEDYGVTVEARADLSVMKGANPDPVIAGETLTYTLTVTNLGPSPSTGSVVSDVLPGGVTFLSSADGCVEAGGTVTCPIAALAPGNGQTVSFDVTVDPSQIAPLVNTATVVGNETDPVPGNNTSPAVTTTVMAESDLVVTVTDGQTQVNPGDTMTYTITVAKSGPSDAPGTRVQDAFPAALLGVTWTCIPSAGSSCSVSGVGDIDDMADLAAGGTVVYEATGTVDVSFAGSLENTAMVTPAVGVDDPNTSNNTAIDVTEVTSPADVSGTLEVLGSVSLGDPGQGFQPGDTVTYLAVLVNASPTAQLDNPGPEFSDTLPVGLVLSNAAADAGAVTLDPSAGTVEWNGVIPGDGAVAITIDAIVEYGTHGQTLVNQGTLFFDADGNGTNESSALTDDPNQGGSDDGTAIVILELVEIPTLGELGLALLVLMLAGAGVRRLGGRG